MRVADLHEGEYHSYYAPYIKLVPDEGELPLVLKDSAAVMQSYLDGLSPERLQFAYAHGKWSMAEVLMHIVDVERVFQHRTFRFARNDRTELPSFDHNSYVPESGANYKSKECLGHEFAMVRNATIALFSSLGQDQLIRMGTASGSQMSVRALGFMICGHQAHHLKVLRERY